MATALEFLKELLRNNVVGFLATTLSLLKDNLSSYADALQDKRKEIEEALKGVKERLGDHHPQKEKLLQGLKESIAEFHLEKLPNLYQVLLNKTKELGEGLQGPKETTSQFLQEKIRWLIALWKALVDFLVQNLEALGEHHPQKEKLLQGLKESIAEFHREKLPNLYQVLLNKTKELGEGLEGPKETASQFLQEKIPWFIALWKALVDFLVQNLEALLPPGTSSDTVRIWVQLVMPLLLFLSLPFLQYFFYGFFVLASNTTIACAKAAYRAIEILKSCARAVYRATIEIIKACARAAWGTTKGGSGKMMKAPGRAGLHIPRAVFESDPGSYFRGLHANAPCQGAMPNSKSKWFIIGVGVVTAGVVLLKLL